MAHLGSRYGYPEPSRQDRYGRNYENDGTRRVPDGDSQFDLGFAGYGARIGYGPERRHN